MFEFGKDLRKLFAQARESEDLSWLELIAANLLEAEARAQSVDAGRVSCARPFDAALRAAALWREHARRSGRRTSLQRADSALTGADRAARSPEQTTRAALEQARLRLLAHELFGTPGDLIEVEICIERCDVRERSALAAQISGVHARLAARRSRVDGGERAMMDAAALMDAALCTTLPLDQSEELQLDRAALLLEAGLAQRDARLLDQAGRDLRTLVEAASPDYRPLTRARALTLCAAGLGALAALADDGAAMEQAHLLFEAAADQFTPDHSPLDWATIQIVRAGSGPTTTRSLLEAEALTAEPGAILAALARERRIAAEAAEAETAGDRKALDRMAETVRLRLSVGSSPVDWAADQAAMASIALARQALGGPSANGLGFALVEAADVAREWGAPALAARATGLRRQLVAA